jgi:hypothetical protein
MTYVASGDRRTLRPDDVFERAADGVAEESLGGAAAVDPGLRRLGLVTEPEELVQERPQDDPAEREPDPGEHGARPIRDS